MTPIIKFVETLKGKQQQLELNELFIILKDN